jgi:ubiquinone/menaquinone biosynthesis C-methylase UbiE
MNDRKDTSWERQGTWYNKLVGDKGHYYHEHIVLPGALRLLDLKSDSKLLDIGCGQGVLAKKIPQEILYTGIDLAKSLVILAQKADTNPKHTYIVADATQPLSVEDRSFTHAAALLSLQNMKQTGDAIKQVSKKLVAGGKFVIILNHPAFRIPRQSGWGVGDNKLQYRYINRYMSALEIPITMHPGEKPSELTWSFHQPISYYAESLKTNGFLIETIEEWTSDRISEGRAARMENRSRSEIPLFMAISATRK